MKKPSFHQHKVRFYEAPQLDYDQLKTRMSIALDKLGHQKFFAEPGSYSLENWMKGVNLLLDEFEEKMGAARLSSEYAEKRRELTDRLSKPVDLSSIDKDIFELKQQEAETARKIDETRERTASKIDQLKKELARRSAELKEEKRRLSMEATEQQSRSTFRRLFRGSSTISIRASRDKLEGLESKLRALPGEITEQRKVLQSINQHSPESPLAEEWKMLESMQARLKELEGTRLEKIQFVTEREEMTASIAGAISRISQSQDKK